jgi:hypothetical protein
MIAAVDTPKAISANCGDFECLISGGLFWWYQGTFCLFLLSTMPFTAAHREQGLFTPFLANIIEVTHGASC